MTKLHLYCLLMTGLILGQSLTRHSRVEAAPSNIFGSSNVAVDVFHNSKGSFVLWSDGRITSTQGGSSDFGRPYREAGVDDVRPPVHQAGAPLGSENVAVQAIPRPDCTLVLFADGTLKRPQNSDAAAPRSGGSGSLKLGRWDGSSYLGQQGDGYWIGMTTCPEQYRPEALALGTDQTLVIRFDQALPAGSEILMFKDAGTELLRNLGVVSLKDPQLSPDRRELYPWASENFLGAGGDGSGYFLVYTRD